MTETNDPVQVIREAVELVVVDRSDDERARDAALASLEQVEALVKACREAAANYELGSVLAVHDALAPFETEDG